MKPKEQLQATDTQALGYRTPGVDWTKPLRDKWVYAGMHRTPLPKWHPPP